jgi:hypothetical protein
LGLTGKIRDASISLETAGQKSEKTNTGFVPLINFQVQWWPKSSWGMLLEGDALAAPQGRAEDVFIGILHRPWERLILRAGYRILEGGADVEQVYNFTLVHFIGLGAEIRY